MAKLKYCIQEHNATHLHWDLRLEHDGVAKSWAVPKKPEFAGSEKRLLVEVEDHDIGYMDFEGSIPEGQYGAGTVKLYDSGFYEAIDIKEGKKWIINLEGNRLKGEFVILHFRDKNWLMFRKN
jgi:bifunctional non-homologous end joining protein LigD